ncbi:MAG: TIGR01906 family membrane protein [Clostridia bacterium]|nr:TIGR01906 family membrane protein [Clostridia bacterium]
MREKIINTGASVLYGVVIAVLVITFSIGLPIYFRQFYYWHIDGLDMVERTGYDYETIKNAYDDVLDYLTVPGNEFGTGELAFSEEGASHFADCKLLFDLNGWAFIISLLLFGLLVTLQRREVITLYRPRGFSISFWSGVGTLSFFASVALLASLDFNTAFVVFHSIFFPGKDNWLFNPHTDEIIRVMPQQFFMNCAILIVCSIIILCAAMIVLGILEKKNRDSRPLPQSEEGDDAE